MRIEPARLVHVNPIAINMREHDRRECFALGRTPKEALRIGLRTGMHTMTAVEDDGTPVAMFGLYVINMLNGEARPWFLGTEAVFRYPRELLVIGRRILGWWGREFPVMENIVAVENDRSIRLLKHWGALLGTERQVLRGIEFLPFHFPAIQAASVAA